MDLMDLPPYEIENIPFRNILIIDNVRKEIEGLANSLLKNGISVQYAENTTKAEEILLKRPEINIIALDWYLDDTDMQAKIFLGNMAEKKFAFAPVIIYSKQPEGIEDFLRERKLERIAIVLDKREYQGDNVLEAIKRWISQNSELRIFLYWSFEVESRLNDSLWRIFELDQEGLRFIIEVIKKGRDDSSHVPEENEVIGLFTKVLSRNLYNELFCTRIKELIEVMESEPLAVDWTDDFERIGNFLALEIYGPPKGKPIWTGDIIRSATGEFSVIVTPICDLCNRGKVDNVLLVKAIPFEIHRKEMYARAKKIKNDDEVKAKDAETNWAQDCLHNKRDSSHWLPTMIDAPKGLVCLFDCLISIPIDKLEAGIGKGEYKRLKTIDSPYIENLIQRLTSYLMRLGVRSIASNDTIAKKIGSKILEQTDPTKKDEKSANKGPIDTK